MGFVSGLAAVAAFIVAERRPWQRLAHRPDDSSYLDSCTGCRVVAHVGETSLMGRVSRVEEDAVVLVDAANLVEDGVGRPLREQALDGEQYVPRAGVWLQVLP